MYYFPNLNILLIRTGSGPKTVWFSEGPLYDMKQLYSQGVMAAQNVRLSPFSFLHALSFA